MPLPPEPQFPVKEGGRFATKAAMPSDWSSVANRAAKRTRSMPRPVASTRRSPNRLVHAPAKGEDTKRMSAKAETTADAARAETPKESAKIGIEGMTMPKPRATKKAIEARTRSA